MQTVTNTRLVESRGKWGKRLTWIGLFFLFGAVFMPFRPELVPWSWPVMIFGFVVTNLGMFYFNRYVRPPLPQDILDKELKGLDNRYRLFNYLGPVEHVLITPTGVLAITIRRMSGDIRCRGEKWSMKTGLLNKLRFFSEDQLGNPSYDLRRDVSKVQNLLESRLPAADGEKPVPIGGFVFFSNPDANLSIEDASVRVLNTKNMKDYLRKLATGERLSPARSEAIAKVLGG
ncbi:MAG: hypothetical protein Q8O07_05605 [Chloroflexota bacterium]|nr:hypothetical protein [Chloroflexota bacterium]